MTIRIVLFSHDSVGLGHVRRNLALAHTLSETLPELLGEPVTGLLISGRSGATSFPTPEGWDWVILPAITAGAGGYVPARLDAGVDAVTAVRSGAARAAIAAFDPDLLIVDRHAFGVHRELAPALAWLREHRPNCVTVLGLRDLLDAPEATVPEWRAIGGAAPIRDAYDAIWVYGDPHVHDLSRSGELPEGLRDLVTHTGYLAKGRPVRDKGIADGPFVLTTVGGGADGFQLARAAAAARTPEGVSHLVVTGPEMPADQRRQLRAIAAKGTKVTRRVPDALGYFRKAAAVVSMGGYNAVAELMSTDTPALIVPRDHRRQEQALRARALQRRGIVDTLPASDATPEALSEWFAGAVGRRVEREGIDLDGLDRIGPFAARLLGERRARKERLRHAV